MKKKLIAGFICTALALSGCSSGGKSEGGDTTTKTIDLRMSVTTSESSVWQVAANEFARIIEEKTQGRYKVSVFPNEQLSAGDMTKGVEMLFNGTTDLDIHSAIAMTGYEPKLAAVSLPWLFPNGYESVDEFLFNGEGGKIIKDLIEKKGAHVLGIGENGFRQITNNSRAIASPKDMERLKIRVPNIAMYIDLFKLMGADPTSMSFSEVFTALQQGTIDGQENPYDTIRSGKIHEVQKYLSVWNYSYDPIVLSVSDKVWKTLSDEDKAIFEAAGKEACAMQVSASRKMDAEIIQEFKDAGVEVTELTEEQINAFRESVAPIYDMYKDSIGEDIYKAFGYSTAE